MPHIDSFKPPSIITRKRSGTNYTLNHTTKKTGSRS
jgi:hypothetical protein